MKTLLRTAVLLLASALSIGRASAQQPLSESASWKIDGETRRAIVYPPSEPIGRAPVVFSFHGHGDTMQNFQYTDMHRAWPEALVIYFQGLPSPRDGEPGWQREKGDDHDRDLKLVDTALAWARKNFRIDEARIYATGFSNGANFTYLLWAERPAIFAAFAPVAARMYASIQPSVPRPIFHVAGQRDPQIPIAEQEAAIAAAKRIDGAAAPVLTWIHPGGHVYPPDTSQRIAKFFRDHPMGR